MVEQISSKVKTQMQTRPKIYLKGNEEQYMTNAKWKFNKPQDPCRDRCNLDYSPFG